MFTAMTDPLSLSPAVLRLLQLTSPTLPIGAYSYSQGLEYAVYAGWVDDETSAGNWILGILQHSLGNLDLPVFARLYHAWQINDKETVHYWDRFLFASRESAELQFEDQQLAAALARLLFDLDIPEAQATETTKPATYAAVYALAAQRWQIPIGAAAAGYLWAWLENQIVAAIKLVPLGQTAGQRILSHAVELIPGVVEAGLACPDEEIGYTAPALAIASARHESQYTRLFRS